MLMVCIEYNGDNDDADDDGYDHDDGCEYAIRPMDVLIAKIHMMNDMCFNERCRQPLQSNDRWWGPYVPSLTEIGDPNNGHLGLYSCVYSLGNDQRKYGPTRKP